MNISRTLKGSCHHIRTVEVLADLQRHVEVSAAKSAAKSAAGRSIVLPAEFPRDLAISPARS
jgi:hypothetical protein